jgi:NTE family protein
MAASIGLALGGGVARGWAHIGVLRTLVQAGYAPDIVTGTSIGAVVGGLYMAGQLDALETWARGLTRARIFGLMDFRLGAGGLVAGRKLKELLEQYVAGVQIENLNRNFAAIATELSTGHETWLREGDLIRAMQASYALPGVFPAVEIEGRHFVDGALTNPVPTAAARAMGARLVIGVSLHADGQLGDEAARSAARVFGEEADEDEAVTRASWTDWVRPDRFLTRLIFGGRKANGNGRNGPGIADTMTGALNIVMDRLTRTRLAADPADILIEPDIGHIGLLEFDRADEMIALGARATERNLPYLERAMRALA